MNLRGLTGAVAAVFLLFFAETSVRAGAEVIPWWEGIHWKVDAVPATSKCIASANYNSSGGSSFIVGFEVFTDGNAELLVYSAAWENMYKQGRKYWVNLGFDYQKPQRMLTFSYTDGGIAFPSLSSDAVVAMAKSASMSIGYQNRIIAGLNLPGSLEAVSQAITCAKKLQSVVAGQHNDGTGPADDGTGPADDGSAATQAPPQQSLPISPPARSPGPLTVTPKSPPTNGPTGGDVPKQLDL